MLVQKSRTLAMVVFVVCLGAWPVEALRASGSTSDIATTRNGDLERADLESLVRVWSDSPTGIALDRVAEVLAGSVSAVTSLNVSVQSGGLNDVTVTPGAQVRYEVVGVLSDNASQGLALIGFDLVFDGGDLGQADTPFGEPTPGCDGPMANFAMPWGITNPAGYGGTVIGGDLIQVGGGQNTINNTANRTPYPIGPVLTGVGQPAGCGPAVLVTGTLTAPSIEGTYTLSTANIFANVIVEGTTGEPYWQSAAIGAGASTSLSITVAAARSAGGAIPAVTGWGLLATTLLLLVGGKIHFGRRSVIR